MRTRTQIIPKQMHPDWLKNFGEHAIVGWYAQVEAAHWQHHRAIERARHLEEDYTDPFDVAERDRYQAWMEKVKPLLPGWYQPGYRLEVEREINACFSQVTEVLNRTIDRRREQKLDMNSQLGFRQNALEWARKQVFALYQALVAERKIT